MPGASGVLVVSDDGETVEEIGAIVRKLDAAVYTAASTFEAEKIAARHALEAVIADVRVSNADPANVLAQIRRHTEAPMLMLTSDDADLAARCLELGVDDCITWPGAPRELEARLQRRTKAGKGEPRVAGMKFDTRERTVEVDGRVVALTDREFDLLRFMAAEPGVPFTCDQLLDAVWESSRDWQSIGTIREHIYRLRKKIEADAAKPQWIVTLRGHGYLLRG